MYSAVCKKFLTYTADDTTKQINPDMNETDMIQVSTDKDKIHIE
jgi:hypothetical protein